MPTTPPLDLLALLKAYWPALAGIVVALLAYFRKPPATVATPPATVATTSPTTSTATAPAALDLLRLEIGGHDFCQALTAVCQAANQPKAASGDNAAGPTLAAVTDQLATLQTNVANLLTIARRWWPLVQLLAKLWGVTLPDLPPTATT